VGGQKASTGRPSYARRISSSHKRDLELHRGFQKIERSLRRWRRPRQTLKRIAYTRVGGPEYERGEDLKRLHMYFLGPISGFSKKTRVYSTLGIRCLSHEETRAVRHDARSKLARSMTSERRKQNAKKDEKMLNSPALDVMEANWPCETC
jgi:hypothetical protein